MENFDTIYSQIKTSSSIQTLYKKNLAIKIGICIIFIAFILFFIIPFDILFFKIITLICTLILIVSFLYKFHLPSYSKAYKKEIVSKIIEMYDTNFKYFANSLISVNLYKSADFEQDFNEFHSEDGICGIFQGIYPFLMGEVKTSKLETYIDSEGKTHKSRTTIFNGFFIQLTTTKSLPCTIYIRKKYPFSSSFSTRKKNISYQNFAHSGINKIQMDDSEFEKSFYVETNNQILTMQLFTLHSLQQLVDFKKFYKLIPEITIKDSTIFIRFFTRGQIFEPPALKSPLAYKEVQKECEFVDSIMNICKNMINNIENLEI